MHKYYKNSPPNLQNSDNKSNMKKNNQAFALALLLLLLNILFTTGKNTIKNYSNTFLLVM